MRRGGWKPSMYNYKLVRSERVVPLVTGPPTDGGRDEAVRARKAPRGEPAAAARSMVCASCSDQ